MKLIKTKLGMFLTQEIYVNDVHVNCIVDTGSPVTLIGKKIAVPCKNSKFIPVFGLNGSNQQALKTKLTVEFSFPASPQILGSGDITFKDKLSILITDLKHIQDNYGKKHNIRGIIGMDIISKTNWLCLQ